MKTYSVVRTPATVLKSAKNLILPALVALALLAGPQTARADLATYEEMMDVAQNWLAYIVHQQGQWAGDADPGIIDIRDIVVNDTLLARYYAISSGGYIIVPALKELPPIKAYSEENYLDIDDEGGFALLIREVLQHRTQLYAEVYGSLDVPQPPGEEPLLDFMNREKYDLLAVSSKDFIATLNNKSLMAPMEGVGPLLTTTWHQGAPYNGLAPYGDGGRCVVGCVATAASQIQFYHQWPPQGEGSHSYTWSGDNSCGGSTPSQVLSADFSDDYVYDETPDAVAEICYEMGVAFEMDYGACASGAYTMWGAYVFPTYYRYDESAEQRNRSDNSQYSWFNLIKNDINKGRPILYRIYSHAIVCDGWRVSGGLDQYHFNYGWGGSQNAWYTVDNLYCPWAGCNTMVEQMVINIIPKNGSPWLNDAVFGDDLGDGDGIPESGETIEMAVTVANYGGAPITDVELNLSIDDGSLNLVDGSTSLGTINANDSVTNDGDPFVFDIPADYVSRIDSFSIEITWNGGAERDTLVVEKSIGSVSILLVDDDNYGDRDSYYEECLGDFRIPYDVWEDAAYLTPEASYLSNYDIVIWFTGDYHTYPISGPEVASMSGYLDNGGKLFLTGQRIAAHLQSFDQGFLNNYLRATYVGTQNIPVLASENGQVFDSGFMVAIQGGNSASNQTYPDLISPANGSVAELKYMAQDYFGAVSYSGAYQLVFFSFGFEAIVSDDSRWRGRDGVMSDILDFFGYQRPAGYPTVADLAVSPGDPTHMLEHIPDLSWSYSDGASLPQTQYHVQVSDDDSWLVSEMWDTGPVTGTENQVTYAGAELMDGMTYYIRARSCNGTLWSDWTYGQMHMNSAPAMATDLNPADLSGVTSANPELSQTNCVDIESDNLTYAYEVYADAEMTVLVDQISGHPQEPSTTSWAVTATLDDDQVYYWRVRGSDPYEDGPWSDLASFWVNSVNSPPEPFDLVSPGDNEQLPGLTVTFDWTESSDADPYDAIVYTLYYSTEADFTPKVTVPDLDSTSYTPAADLEYGTTYYWKVKAQDLFYGQTYSSQTYAFTTINRGDANGDGTINVADAVFLINFIFRNGPAPDPLISGDANCDTNPNVGDAVYIINYVFKGGPEPGCN